MTVNNGDFAHVDIGSETVVSQTIWSQTVPWGQQGLVSSPIGGTVSVTNIGWGTEYVIGGYGT